jgi:hypothetical protein
MKTPTFMSLRASLFEAKQSQLTKPEKQDCFVASFLAMTVKIVFQQPAEVSILPQ